MSDFPALDVLLSLSSTDTETVPTQSEQPESPDAPRQLSKLPSYSDVTVANAYVFLNEGEKNLWQKWRVNFQLFTQTQPFTPDYKNAAWCGSAVLRYPDVFSNVMERYRYENEDKFPHDMWEERYMPAIRQTSVIPAVVGEPDFPRLGQLQMAGSGTYYEFGSFAEAYYTNDGEFRINLMLLDGTISFQDFMPGSGRVSHPVLRASYDPRRLWLRKKASKVKKS